MHQHLLSRRSFALAVCGTFFAQPSLAQQAGYTRLNVKNRVQVEIPDDWTINDAEHRQRIRDFATNLMGTASAHVAALSAASYPMPSRAFVRVSFIPLNPPISQADLKREVQADRHQVLRDLADSWKEEAPRMWEALGKRGIKEVGRAAFAVEPLGGQLAMIIRYARTSSQNSSEVMNVAQFHVPLGADKALITLSSIDGDQAAKAAVERVRTTLRIN